MNYFIIALSFLLFVSCSSSQYSTSNRKAIKLFEQGKDAPSLSIDPLTNTPNYKEGIRLMNQALDKDAMFWEAHMFAGEFSEIIGDLETAIDHYKSAIEINPQHTRTGSTYFYLANLQQAVGSYQDAIKNIEIFTKFKNANPDLLVKARAIKDACLFAIESMKNPNDFNPINIGPGINTSDPEYFPTITVDGETILFTRRIKDGRVYGPVKEQEDFYVSQLSNQNIWQTAVPMPENVNTVNNEGAPTIAADGRSLVFVACPDATGTNYGSNRNGKGSCDLFFSKKLGTRWTDPINLPGNVNSYHWETQPSLSSDGKTMYFIRGIRNRNQSRNSDIYVTRKDQNGNWGTAQKLPEHINTPAQEESVLIHPDGRTLYFASRGHIGMGGSDLFVTRLSEDGTWSSPKNLGYPINTKYDENSLMVAPDGEIAFFASDREGGFGDLDIYYFVMPEEFRPTRTLYFEGIVFDITNHKPIPGKFQLIDLETGKEVVYSEADDLTGEFIVSLPTNKKYALNVTYPGYAFFSENFDMKNPEGLEAIHMDVPLVPLESEHPILLANIFFDLGMSTLRPESFIELDKLVSFLEENPTVKVEIGGHTDSRGSNNKVLSENRAKAVYNYCLDKKISQERLTSKGYGSSQPVFDDNYIANLTSDKQKQTAHQANRRTEYKIIK